MDAATPGVRANRHRTGSNRTPHFTHGKPLPPLARDLSAVSTPTADHRQAAYFVQLLTQHLEHVERRIDKSRKAVTDSGAGDEIDHVRGCLTLVEEQERQALVTLIAKLQRRFVVPRGGGGC